LAQKENAVSLATLPDLQAFLLDAYCPLVRPGGRLVFGVCTLRRAETVGVLERFFARHPEFEPTGGGFLGPISRSADAFFMFAAHRLDKSAMNLMQSQSRKAARQQQQAGERDAAKEKEKETGAGKASAQPVATKTL
jgi:16S rRNA C967 or C1407 C5-methylase (RsmB/RsmF family)